MADKLYFDVRYNNGVISAAASGVLGFFTAPDFKTKIAAWIEPGVTAIQIDLQAIAHVDSAGIAVLIQAVKTCAQKEVTFRLMNPPASVRTIFEKSGLSNIIT